MADRPYPSFRIYIDKAGEYRWHYQAANREIVADSAEGYKRLEDCEHGISLIRHSFNAETWYSEEAARKEEYGS
jgi:uncharacterized protein YegP (UPF0339 family)